MSFGAKQNLIADFKAQIGKVLSIEQTEATTLLLQAILEKYDIEECVEEAEPGVDLLDAFLSTKKVEGKSPKTIWRYGYILRGLLDYVKTPVNRITVHHIRAYFANKKERGVSDSTLDGERSIFSSFFNWLNREGLIRSNPCSNLGKIKHQQVVRKPFTPVDIECIKENCKRDVDKAVVAFMLSTGCRISEVCGLNRNDVDLVKKECIVLGKGNKQRAAYFDDVTAMLLKRYLDGRKDDYDPLFLSRNKTRFSQQAIRAMLCRVSRRCGVEKIHPHRFRRTMATSMIKRGMSIQEVAHLLGHEKIDTTMKYVYIDESDVKTSFQKCC